MNNWKRTVTRIFLSEEPYPEADYECEDCGFVWPDTEDPKCNCETEVDKSEDDGDSCQSGGSGKGVGILLVKHEDHTL